MRSKTKKTAVKKAVKKAPKKASTKRSRFDKKSYEVRVMYYNADTQVECNVILHGTTLAAANKQLALLHAIDTGEDLEEDDVFGVKGAYLCRLQIDMKLPNAIAFAAHYCNGELYRATIIEKPPFNITQGTEVEEIKYPIQRKPAK